VRLSLAVASLLFLLASLSFENSRVVALSATGAEAGSPLVVVILLSPPPPPSLFARHYLPAWKPNSSHVVICHFGRPKSHFVDIFDVVMPKHHHRLAAEDSTTGAAAWVNEWMIWELC